ncbi:hypothetical protein ASF06_16590 [Agreia sp. Leaf244]|uniref:hypothetical protein n=1 Tax=Agreia sp. Leaf244 TaxID=1736305 RepID=UPI0006FCC720|nr:hypothetical protein [Agreia sp. Leaf244]KQO06654.1 hypothetical protein ASF06_16590 [Agreia sp. Leaf244]
MIGLGLEPEGSQCSRAGCRDASTWRIEWRNPKIHAETRRKVWLACDEHVDFLREFLAARDFPLEVMADGGTTAPGSGTADAMGRA